MSYSGTAKIERVNVQFERFVLLVNLVLRGLHRKGPLIIVALDSIITLKKLSFYTLRLSLDFGWVQHRNLFVGEKVNE